MTTPASASPDWPGQRLGLPASGPRSVARLGRRIAALAIDYVPVFLISFAFFDYDAGANLVIFAVLQVLVILLMGGSIGHLVMRIRVVPITGGRLKFWQPFVRTILLCLVIPAVIWNTDQRGLHDIAAGTFLVRV